MRATIEDVAKRAGVSTATVSRAMRGLPNVTPSTRNRVLRAAKELSYVMHPQASRLATGRTMTICIVVPLADQWFYNKVVTSAEAALVGHSYDVLRYSVTSAQDRQLTFERLSSPKRGDGIIIVTVSLSQTEIDLLVRSGVPVVTIETVLDDFSSVSIDNVAAAEKAVQHLIALGHRRIGLISGLPADPMGFTVPRDRREGYKRVLYEHGIRYDPALEASGNFSLAGGTEAMDQLLNLPRPPTAIFAFSDEMAIGAMKSVRDRGLRIPEDISIIGFDDHDIAGYIGLTTIRQHVAQYGETAATLLLALLDDEDPSHPTRHIVKPTELIVRSSTGPCKN